ncbi:MAG: hypothetical protein U0166_28295 [Acidobacteriota bacterium]
MKPALRLRSLVLLLAPLALRAEPLPKDKVPEPLKPWVDWALHEEKDFPCPFFQGDGDRRQCVWPSRLALGLDDKGGTFTQQWQLAVEEWVPLPGDAKVWPLDVQANGKPVAVSDRDGRPGVRLPPGVATLQGRFTWASLPELLQVPPETGLLSLTLRGTAVPFPNRDAEGRLWLQKRTGAGEGESQLEVTVHRRVVDEVPLQLTTRIILKVSGESREVLLSTALPKDFVPMAMESPLPARIEPDMKLRVQARAGAWTIEIVARHEGPVTELSPPAIDGPWAEEEQWVFDARSDLRLVAVEGVTAIDPQQTELPDEWRSLPAYAVHPGETMKLAERRRGDADPAPDRLTLRRDLWLDFDGGGYTIKDRITGTLERSWRLEMKSPVVLGRVAIENQDQLITALDKTNQTSGVEVRQGQVNVDADSRVTGSASSIPAVGWNHDFQDVAATLHLPPGWRILHATGVDDVATTWWESWTLLDLFVVLITTMILARYFGILWGALGIATLVLIFKEHAAPRYVWLSFLAVEALARVLPKGWLTTIAGVVRMALLILIALLCIPFAVEQVRRGLYPILERPYDNITQGSTEGGRAPGFGSLGYVQNAPPPPPAAPKPEGGEFNAEEVPNEPNVEQWAEKSAEPRKMMKTKMKYVQTAETKAQVSTGPGLPSWTWTTVDLKWRGPVQKAQGLHFYLVSPRVGVVLAFSRVALLTLLFLRLLRASLARLAASGPAVAVAILFLVATVAPPAVAGDIPSNELLEQLKSRLVDPPQCFPSCATAGRLLIELNGGVLTARIELHAEADTAVPLPGDGKAWLPAQVILDGQPANGLLLTDQGQLWMALPQGAHQVTLSGPLPDRDIVAIPLPLKPHHAEGHVAGFTVDGIRPDGSVDDSIQLTRAHDAGSQAAKGLQPGELPPFVRVDRSLELDISWKVTTTVTRLTPPGSVVVLELPLLEGESVTTEDVHVANGKVQLSMGPQATEAQWVSTLAEAPSLKLEAPSAVPFTEVWHLDASPLWHVEPQGIPVIHQQAGSEDRVREWRPWPGESVTLAITRPEGVPGQTLTIDRASQDVKPALRATDVTLTLGIRSSRGAQHTLVLPDGAELISVTIKGLSQPIRQEGRNVVLPIVPGAQDVLVVFRQPRGITSRFTTPAIDAGAPSVNSTIDITMPADRWTLLCGGPPVGPAVLFWSVLVILLLISIGLGRIRLTPLRAHHWFLLGIGLTQVHIAIGAAVAGWILVVGWRKARGTTLHAVLFDLLQLLIIGWTLVSLGCLAYAIQQGLLGRPEMQIKGNASDWSMLRFYLDRAGNALPTAWVISLPRMVYRLCMLAWALWLSLALLSWLRWTWSSFTDSGLWRPVTKLRPPRPKAKPPASPPSAPAGQPASTTP